MTDNLYRIEDPRRRQNEVEQQRQVAADAVRRASQELKRLERLEDAHGGSDRAS